MGRKENLVAIELKIRRGKKLFTLASSKCQANLAKARNLKWHSEELLSMLFGQERMRTSPARGPLSTCCLHYSGQQFSNSFILETFLHSNIIKAPKRFHLCEWYLMILLLHIKTEKFSKHCFKSRQQCVLTFCCVQDFKITIYLRIMKLYVSWQVWSEIAIRVQKYWKETFYWSLQISIHIDI